MMSVWAALLVLAGLGSDQVRAGDVPVGLRADLWCPFNCQPQSQRPGLLIEVAQQAFADRGIDYQLMNWARAVEASRSGEFHGIVGAFVGDAPDFYFPSLPITQTRNCFYRKAQSSWQFESMESLDSVRLGVSNAYDYGPEMDAYIRDNLDRPDRILVASGDLPAHRSLRLLRYQRIDAFIESREVMAWLKQINSLSDIEQAGCLPIVHDVYIAFSPALEEAAALAEQLGKAVARMRDSGQLQRLHHRYGIEMD